MYNLAQRTLLLTGANGGIGRETARLFHEHGANLVLADLDAAGLADFARELDPEGKQVVTLGMDASSKGDCARAAAAAQERFGGIDFLVPAAAIYEAQPIETMSDVQWRNTMAVNLDGVFFLLRHAMPALRENSAIVMLTSMAAHRGSHYNAHYSASKGALISLTRSLARELGPRTRVNAVSPGIINTPMTAGLVQKRGATSIEQTPLGRLGHPREVATVIEFLCSDAASFMTGEVLQVNGGLHMG